MLTVRITITSNSGWLTQVFKCQSPELRHRLTEASGAETWNPVKTHRDSHNSETKIPKMFGFFNCILQQFSVYKLKVCNNYRYLLIPFAN